MRRPCSRCDIMFSKNGKKNKVCNTCISKAVEAGRIKRIKINEDKKQRKI